MQAGGSSEGGPAERALKVLLVHVDADSAYRCVLVLTLAPAPASLSLSLCRVQGQQ